MEKLEKEKLNFVGPSSYILKSNDMTIFFTFRNSKSPVRVDEVNDADGGADEEAE